MEASTTVKKMLAGNEIFVPTYQRAYSWDTNSGTNKKDAPRGHTNVFLSDLEAYNKTETKSRYYFGHFLFEEKSDNEFGVIDGQQRLTTIVIFLSALFKHLKLKRELSDAEQDAFEDFIKRRSIYHFKTVDYDGQFFKDYVIDQTTISKEGLNTESAKRIANAFDFFVKELEGKDEAYLLKMLETIQNASCTTHPVVDESEAIQMFIFQNGRGKKPSNLELIKAQFMFKVHLYAGEAKNAKIEEIKNRFNKIYRSISSIEHQIDEDEVLLQTIRVYFDLLWESNITDRINNELSKDNSISFIISFAQELADSFDFLTAFFGKDEKANLAIHSLIALGRIGVALPFVIKAYKFGLDITKICELCSALESIILRHRLIGTRADIIPRLNEVFRGFTVDQPDITPIIKSITAMKLKPSGDWWGYWNNTELERSLQHEISPPTAKYLLWKYENHLKGQGKSGYVPARFDSIINPELEHIAPKGEQTSSNSGYEVYDDDFKTQYLECLGNYLLLSKSHNCAIGNIPFADKRATYTHLEQQREIQNITNVSPPTWTKAVIKARKDKIITFLMSVL